MAPVNEKDVLTTGEVARICHVAPRTVSKWFDEGKLRGYRIPGSRDRRIPRQQLVAFMRAHGMPLDGIDGGICRVLIVDPSAPQDVIETLNGTDQYSVHTAANGFEAGVQAQQLHPHVVVIDVTNGIKDAVEICRKIKSSEAFAGAKVIATCTVGKDNRREQLLKEGFDAVLAKPYSPVQLAEAIEDATDLIH